MKTLMKTLLTGLLLLSISGIPAIAAETNNFVIGLPDILGEDIREDYGRAVLEFILLEVPIDSRIQVYDASNLKLLADIRIPDRDALSRPKVRAGFLKKDLDVVKRYLIQNRATEDWQVGGQVVLAPQFMDLVSRTATTPGGITSVLLLGSPLYVDPANPGFSMEDGFYPSDAHLLSTRGHSVFGIAGSEEKLEGVRVHMGWVGSPWWNDQQAYKVERFWSLFLQHQGAVLETFVGDLGLAAKRATRFDLQPPTVFILDSHQAKLEMFRAMPGNPWPDEMICTELSMPGEILKGKVKIGIRWEDMSCDLDLYAKAGSGSEEIYYLNPRTEEGLYFKDYHSGRSPRHGYEFIEFLDEVNIEQLEVWVNFFSGQAPKGVKGELRVHFQEEVFSREFRIPATAGNRGLDKELRNGNGCWARLDLAEILGARPVMAAKASGSREGKISLATRESPLPGFINSGNTTGVRILSPADGENICLSPAEQTPAIRPVKGDIVGYEEGEIEELGLVVEVAVLSDHWDIQGIAKVKPDGTWRLRDVNFVGSRHDVKAVLMDGYGNEIVQSIVGVMVVQ